MSLTKIPVIVALSFAFKLMLTPPNPPPPKSELVPTSSFDMARVRSYRLALAKLIQYRTASIEVATILAHATPNNRLSQIILKKCVFKGGHPQNMRISHFGALGAVLFFAGVILRASTYHRLGRFFTFDISIQKNHELVKTGPYAFVRHPSYSGLLTSTVGWLIWTFSKGSWVGESGILNTKFGKPLIAAYIITCILPPSFVTLSRMQKEDDALKEQFGEEWEAWAASVPYSVIPGLY